MFRPPPAGGAGLKAPTGGNAHDRVLLHTPPGMKVQFPGGARLGRTPPRRATRRQGNADLWAVLPVGPGTARRRRAAGRTPSSGGAPLGRDPGVQRQPDGCVVHAFRCAPRSGAGPNRENWPEVGVPVPARHPFFRGSRVGLHFHSKGGAALTLAEPDVIGAGFALPRVPTGGRRSPACAPSVLTGVGRNCILTATGRRSRTGRPGPGSGLSPRAQPPGSPV